MHADGFFIIPNPWDIGGLQRLEKLGFKAIASTSAGFAWSTGHADHQVTVEMTLHHLRAISQAVDVPVNADFGEGFGIAPDAVAVHAGDAAMTGIAGLSIEDATGDPSAPLFDFTLAVERIAAARQAIDARRPGILLTGRSEGFIAGRPDLDETVRRLKAYASAGADCLYAPGLRSIADIKTVVAAVAPKPVNVLVSSDFTTVDELRDAGVRRISVGGALARTAWTLFMQAAKEIAEHGTFTTLSAAIPGANLNQRFTT